MIKKEYVCIVCPNSCRLTVTDDQGKIAISGEGCKRGVSHGIKEYTRPTRMLTTTVRITNGTYPRLPVISSDELPKDKLSDCLAILYQMELRAPVTLGDILVENICQTGVDIIASRSMAGCTIDCNRKEE